MAIQQFLSCGREQGGVAETSRSLYPLLPAGGNNLITALTPWAAGQAAPASVVSGTSPQEPRDTWLGTQVPPPMLGALRVPVYPTLTSPAGHCWGGLPGLGGCSASAAHPGGLVPVGGPHCAGGWWPLTATSLRASLSKVNWILQMYSVH